MDPRLTARPTEDALRVIASAKPAVTNEPLFVLTNRLSPTVLAVRILANLLLDPSQAGEPPTVDAFQQTAAAQARALGLRLRAEDQAQGVKGSGRRFVGWPTGEDAQKAQHRFIASFLLYGDPAPDPNEEPGQRLGTQGPMADLGLAVTAAGRAMPTRLGLAVAAAPSPLLGEATGWTLARDQQRLMRAAVLAMPGERAEIATFLRAVLDAPQGAQFAVDERLRKAHPDWSDNRIVAHRAAMLGRLRDLGVTEVTGRGAGAQIRLLDAEAGAFVEQVLGRAGAASQGSPTLELERLVSQ